MGDSGTSERLILIGRLTAAHGIKGWIKVYSYTDPPEKIISYTPWHIKLAGQWLEVKVTEGHKQGKSIIVHLDGCESRDDTGKYVGADIAIPASSLEPLPEGEYYWEQLEGLEVINLDEMRFGVVDQLLQTGANDVMVIKADADSIDDRERLIPFVMNKVIRSIDLETGRIIVDWDASW